MRAVELSQCIAQDFQEKLKKLIASTPLMDITFNSDSNVTNKSGDPPITYVALKDRIKILQESWTTEVKAFKGKI